MNRDIKHVVILLSFLAVIWAYFQFTGESSEEDILWKINREVSHKFTYVTDMEKWGVEHYSEEGVTGEKKFTGDCEEYAKAIKYQLHKVGIDSTIWAVWNNETNEYHTITCTLDGWCLDDNTRPMREEDTNYVFIQEIN